MALTEAQQREAATKFYNDWRGKGDEKSDCQRFWIEFFTNVLGIENVTQKIVFEKRVVVNDQTKFIDVYIPETRVLIEQKSVTKELDQKITQSDGSMMTPFEQGRNYAHWMIPDETPLWIIACNFKTFEIHNMNKPKEEPTIIHLDEVRSKLFSFDFMFKKEVKEISQEMEISVKAGEIVGILYDKLLAQYTDVSEQTLKDLNALCVRLVFCLYAEDANIFGHHMMFHDYLADFPANKIRTALRDLFKILDMTEEERKADPDFKYIAEENPKLAAFPYVNGGLFADTNIEIPPFTDELKQLLIERASADFDWKDISPTIFGAVFESTLNPETRRAGGMHYTSIENIHHVIDPLFLNDLVAELERIEAITIQRNREKQLLEYQTKLSKLKFFDPACGSGNFLTETYISIRRLENRVLSDLNAGQMVLTTVDTAPIKVTIDQFYGIEINDFAVTVAKTALWIAESQMLKETEDILVMQIDFLPLKTNAFIHEGNALTTDWNEIIPNSELTYIMGNPPFIGHQWRTAKQVEDMKIAFHDLDKHGKLDYVCAWYNKAADYMQNTKIQCAFVSTNSICQGESVGILWSHLFEKKVEIQFAYRTFVWTSEASDQAAVHCVIVGFSCYHIDSEKTLFEENIPLKAKNINGFLVDAPNIFIQNRGDSINKGLPKLFKGSQPTDGNHLILTPEEYEEFASKYPEDTWMLKKYIGSQELINAGVRYCIWLQDVSPAKYVHNKFILDRLEKVSEFRKTSATASVRDAADTPSLFTQIRQPDTDYLAVPAMSSGSRTYIPIGFLDKDTIASNQLYIMPNANLYIFGILMSNVHNAWMQVVCGRLKSDFRYAPAVYNNLPFPEATEEAKAKIAATAQKILDLREKYSDCSLALLYGKNMPYEYKKAHEENDKAVMQAYGFWGNLNTKADCVAALMKMYEEKTK